MAAATKVNKSEEVRKLHSSGVTSAKEIMEKLKSRGIKVAPAQVYQVISKKKKRRGKKQDAEPTAEKPTVVDHAIVFVRAAGGMNKAREMLAKLAQLAS